MSRVTEAQRCAKSPFLSQPSGSLRSPLPASPSGPSQGLEEPSSAQATPPPPHPLWERSGRISKCLRLAANPRHSGNALEVRLEKVQGCIPINFISCPPHSAQHLLAADNAQCGNFQRCQCWMQVGNGVLRRDDSIIIFSCEFPSSYDVPTVTCHGWHRDLGIPHISVLLVLPAQACAPGSHRQCLAKARGAQSQLQGIGSVPSTSC